MNPIEVKVKALELVIASGRIPSGNTKELVEAAKIVETYLVGREVK